MNKFNATLLKIAGAASVLAAFSAPALAQQWVDDRSGNDRSGYDQRWDRDGHDGRGDRDGRRGYNELRGPGVRHLMPILRDTREGLRFARQHADRNGWMGPNEARRANFEFRRSADRNRDGRVSNREAEWALNGRGDRNHFYSDNDRYQGRGR
jgi:hypothetical protein